MRIALIIVFCLAGLAVGCRAKPEDKKLPQVFDAVKHNAENPAPDGGQVPAKPLDPTKVIAQ